MSDTFAYILGAVLVIFFGLKIIKKNKEAQSNIDRGRVFLAANLQAEDVQVTHTGLQYQILSKGTGTQHPKPTDRVSVHYHGTLVDGTVFDSSIVRGEPIEFGLGMVIKGWTEGLQLMVEGQKMRFFIPPDLGYGNRSAGKIGANSVLIFEVELLAIKSL